MSESADYNGRKVTASLPVLSPRLSTGTAGLVDSMVRYRLLSGVSEGIAYVQATLDALHAAGNQHDRQVPGICRLPSLRALPYNSME